jgi:hypothetical protein
MKFKNGKLSTWYIVKRLSSDSELYAEAPDTPDLYPCIATTDGMHIEFNTQFPVEDEIDGDGSPPIRNDWTLRRKGGGRVNKPELVDLGDVLSTDTATDGKLWVIQKLDDLRGEYQIIARKVR